MELHRKETFWHFTSFSYQGSKVLLVLIALTLTHFKLSFPHSRNLSATKQLCSTITSLTSSGGGSRGRRGEKNCWSFDTSTARSTWHWGHRNLARPWGTLRMALQLAQGSWIFVGSTPWAAPWGGSGGGTVPLLGPCGGSGAWAGARVISSGGSICGNWHVSHENSVASTVRILPQPAQRTCTPPPVPPPLLDGGGTDGGWCCCIALDQYRPPRFALSNLFLSGSLKRLQFGWIELWIKRERERLRREERGFGSLGFFFPLSLCVCFWFLPRWRVIMRSKWRLTFRSLSEPTVGSGWHVH